MTNCRMMARIGAAAVLAVASCVVAQVTPPNVPPSGSASQNSAPATGTAGAPGTGMSPNDAMTTPSATMSSQKDMDKQFVQKSIMGNHAEVDAGNLALQKSSNDEVKKFAQKMVTDHTAMLDEMNRLAEQLQIKAPQSASAKDKAEAAKLSAMSGNAFDTAYVKAMVKDHKKDVSELKDESKNASTPQVKDAAMKALPVVEGHLDMIQGIQKNMMAANGTASTK